MDCKEGRAPPSRIKINSTAAGWSAALRIAAALGAALICTPGVARADQSAQAFYKGKVLTVIVPYGAAGGYEYWAAALKPYLQKALGVSQINLVNKTGGGGVVGANYLYHAKPDGLTIGEVNGIGAVFAQIAKKPGVEFDMTKFDWIGAPNVETTVTVARLGSPYKSFADLWKLRGGAKKVICLSAGYGGSNYVGTAIPLSAFGIPYRMLLAYQGSSAVKAGLLRGDGDVATQGYPVFRPLLESSSVIPLYFSDPTPFAGLPGVPTIVQLAKQYALPKANQKTIEIFARAVAMGKDWTAPPGVSADRLAFLRKAFRNAVHDKGFVEAVKKADRVPAYRSSGSLMRTITDVNADASDFAPFLKH